MQNETNLFTIGFTQKTAEQFFSTLVRSGVTHIIDTRLNNVSQLSGFAKRDDLKFFLEKIGRIKYTHFLDLAPEKDMLDDYKKKRISWDEYESKFNNLIKSRRIEEKISSNFLENGCLLCSESKPNYCHRRLVAEYLQKTMDLKIRVKHL